MAKLGYTWYPKDWGNSESVFELTLVERGLYRELIDMAMLNDNKTQVNIKVWARKFGSTEEEIESILITLTDLNLIELKKDLLFIPSCESRLNLVRGGSKGGKKSKPNKKPIQKPFESLEENNQKPTINQIEKENKIESKKEIEKENKNNIFLNELLNSDSWLESLAMNNKNKFNVEQIKEKLKEFTNEINLKFDVKLNKKDFTSHFVSWLNLKTKENLELKRKYQSSTPFGTSIIYLTDLEFEEKSKNQYTKLKLIE